MKSYKRSFKTRKKKKFIKIKTVLLIVFFLMTISSFAYLLFFSSIFKIKEIKVSGVKKIPEKELQDIISEKINKNIFFADLENIKNYLIESYPEIAKIEIKRKLPNSIITEIEERKPVAVLNNSFVLDKEGIAFEKSPNSNLPKITKAGFNNVKLGEKAIDRIEDILKIIKRIETKEAIIVSDKRLDIKTTDGFDVYFNLEKDIDWQIEQLEIILQEKIPLQERNNIEYIDLRFDKIYIKKAS